MTPPASAFFETCTRAFERAEVVSFDVFDTLLERPFERPIDLFVHVGHDAAPLLRDAARGIAAR